MSKASIDFKKIVPFGLSTENLVILLLSIHPSIIIVHLLPK